MPTVVWTCSTQYLSIMSPVVLHSTEVILARDAYYQLSARNALQLQASEDESKTRFVSPSQS